MNDGEIPDPETTTAIVAYEPPPAPLTLFGTNDPRTALERMSDLARALIDVVHDRKLAVRISGRDHLTAEAWTTLGGMLGIVPITEWTRPLEDGSGWEARVEARTLDGRTVGAAESMCSRSETTWAKRDEYALRSMAQTRAISRALRAPLGQIVVLAGYEPAGADEMPVQDTAAQAPTNGIPAEPQPTAEQREQLQRLLTALAEVDPQTDWAARARKMAGVPSEKVTAAIADLVLENLRAIHAQSGEKTA
jgi:hypothetical protein